MPQQDDALQRVSRVLRILQIVAARPAGRPVTRDDLALDCGCDVHTISTDIRLLRKGGVPLDYDRRARTYALPDKGWTFPVPALTGAEALTLALARALLAVPGMPIQGALLAALDTLTAGLAPSLRDLAVRAAAAVRADPLPRDYSLAALDTLAQAVRDRRTLEVDYESRSSGRRLRRLDPYGLGRRDGLYWELHAWDHARAALRTFALDRVHRITPTGDGFERREDEWAAFERTPGVVGGLRAGAPIAVDAVIAPAAAPYAQGRRWPDGLTVTPLPGGAVRLTGTALGVHGVLTELLRWRRHCTVYGGPELLQAMHGELTAMIALYGEKNISVRALSDDTPSLAFPLSAGTLEDET